jgi:hypothetical protein
MSATAAAQAFANAKAAVGKWETAPASETPAQASK